MKEQEIKKLELALGFKREIVGIKFIFIQEEYENIPVKEMEKRNTLNRENNLLHFDYMRIWQ